MNPRSGDDSPSADELLATARERGIEAHILGEDDDAAELARAAEADALGMAGGDGSLAPVAQVAIERDLPFVCIPFGTRNHFARDLGLDRDDPIGALDAFRGRERRIDVGRVRGDVFLNNVSLGVYAALVHRRERHRRRRNAFARLRALLLTVTNRESLGLTVDGEPVEAQVALVSNNGYKLEVFSLGERERLDEGKLHVYLARGWRLSEWEERVTTSLTIDAARHRIKAAVDGEPAVFETPVEFEIDPLALRVLVPAAPG
ncbi:MAG TPA: diacylglycerol kinase family protein [Gaiellaceae bacterium]